MKYVIQQSSMVINAVIGIKFQFKKIINYCEEFGLISNILIKINHLNLNQN
jgi:hypothetical protein